MSVDYAYTLNAPRLYIIYILRFFGLANYLKKYDIEMISDPMCYYYLNNTNFIKYINIINSVIENNIKINWSIDV